MRSRFAAGLAIIVVVALALRVPGLGREGLWTDEATTGVLCEQPLAGMLAMLRADVQAPLYYVLGRAVTSVFGTSELSLRGLSVAIGLATVLACGLLGRRFLGDAGGLVAAGLLAISPLHVAYSREARAYVLLALLVVLAFGAVDALRRQPGPWRALAAGLLLALLPLAHGLGALHAAGVALAAAAPDPRDARAWCRRALPMLALAAAVAVLASLPWTLTSLRQGSAARVIYAWATPLWERDFPWQPALSLMVLSPGASAPLRSIWTREPLDAVAAAIAAALVIAALAHRRRLARGDAPVRLVLAIGLALGLVFAASCVVGPLHVVGRAEAPLACLAVLVAAAGLASVRRPLQIMAGLAIAALAAPGLVVLHVESPRSHERELARMVADRVDRGDAVVVLGPYRWGLEYYLPRMTTEVTLRSFPAAREAHPSWVDWQRLDAATLEGEARLLANEVVAAVASRDGMRVLVVAVAEPGTEVLRHGLGEALARKGVWLTPVDGLEVWHYELPAEP